MTIQYVHTFVFACANCRLPAAVTRVSGEQTRKSFGDGSMRTFCGWCGKACYGSAATAQHHYVEEWRRALRAGHH
jgi:hypothetical protein